MGGTTGGILLTAGAGGALLRILGRELLLRPDSVQRKEVNASDTLGGSLAPNVP